MCSFQRVLVRILIYPSVYVWLSLLLATQAKSFSIFTSSCRPAFSSLSPFGRNNERASESSSTGCCLYLGQRKGTYSSIHRMQNEDNVGTGPSTTSPLPELVQMDIPPPNSNQTTGTTAEVLTLDGLMKNNISSTVSYFYLHNELGLSEEAMWKITLEAGSALGMRASTVRRKVDLMRDTMELTDQDVVTILERQPTILHLSADQNIAPTMLFLLRSLELGRSDLRKLVVQEPSLLCYKTSTLQSKIQFFTKIMGYSITECRNVLLEEPRLLRSSAENGLIPHFRFLLHDVSLPIEQIRKVVAKYPRILLMSLDDNLVPKLIFFLIMYLHMTPKQVGSILLSYPQLLDYNLDRHTTPIAEYFIQELGFQPTEFRSIILKFPRLVSYSLRNIKHYVGYLKFELGLMEAAQVKRVLYQAPALIGFNTDVALRSKVEFLQSRLELSHEELQSVVTGMPSLLGLSIEKNLGPKIDYLQHCCFPSLAALRQCVLRLPTLLGYSLDKRIRPRMEAILDSGLLDPGCITIAIPMKEEAFVGWLERRIESAAAARDVANRGTDKNSKKLTATSPDVSQRIAHWTRESD